MVLEKTQSRPAPAAHDAAHLADPLEEHVQSAAALMSMLSSASRLRILCRLVKGECNVGELAERCGVSQPTMSQQLKKLRDAGLIEARRDAQTIYYAISGPEVLAVLDTLYGLYCAKAEE